MKKKVEEKDKLMHLKKNDSRIIKNIRKQTKLSQNEFANTFTVSYESMKKIEYNKIEPNISSLLYYSESAKIPLDLMLSLPNIADYYEIPNSQIRTSFSILILYSLIQIDNQGIYLSDFLEEKEAKILKYYLTLPESIHYPLNDYVNPSLEEIDVAIGKKYFEVYQQISNFVSKNGIIKENINDPIFLKVNKRNFKDDIFYVLNIKNKKEFCDKYEISSHLFSEVFENIKFGSFPKAAVVKLTYDLGITSNLLFQLMREYKIEHLITYCIITLIKYDILTYQNEKFTIIPRYNNLKESVKLYLSSAIKLFSILKTNYVIEFYKLIRKQLESFSWFNKIYED